MSPISYYFDAPVELRFRAVDATMMRLAYAFVYATIFTPP